MNGRQALAVGAALVGLVVLAACASPAPRAAGGVAPARAAPPPRERVRLIYTSQGPTQVPILLAQEGGHFLANALDVDLTFVAGSATATQALLAGEADLVAQSGGATVSAALNGGDTLLVATTHGTFTHALAGAPTLAGVDALRGGVVGVARYGTTADFAARFALQQAGLEPGVDVTLIATGGNAETLAALRSGALQAALVSDGFGFELQRLGYPRLLDLADLGVEYSHSGLATTRAYADERPQAVRRVLRAVLQGMGQFVREPATAKRVLARHSQLADPAALDHAWEAHATKYLKRVPYTTPGGMRLVLDELAARQENARTANPEEFYDNRFVAELDASGFLATLY
jgi:ABC-type nitrate/sulfonate/bicarbonate transport system substrate-binding protein